MKVYRNNYIKSQHYTNMMALALEAELYAPNRDDHGTYIDFVPSICILKYGIRCACGSRKDQTFYSTAPFKKHLQCQKHKAWLKMKNLEPQNDIKIIHEHEKTIKNQQLLINKMDLEIQTLKKKIIDLEAPKHVPLFDLLGIDE